MDINWKEPWDELCVSPNTFERQLLIEIGDKHILFKKKVRCIGRRYDRGEFLFEIDDEKYKLAVVHLTYSKGSQNSSSHPITKLFLDEDDFTKNCMLLDNMEFE